MQEVFHLGVSLSLYRRPLWLSYALRRSHNGWEVICAVFLKPRDLSGEVGFLQVCQGMTIGSWGSRKFSFVFLEKPETSVNYVFPLSSISRLSSFHFSRPARVTCSRAARARVEGRGRPDWVGYLSGHHAFFSGKLHSI